MRLLIASSDATMCDIYERFFSGEGYEVEVVRDGLQCLNAARARVPDVLILEYELPWGGGAGVLARLREETRLASVDVVLVTCYDSDEVHEHEPSPPVRGCLRKPFLMRDLSKLVRSVTQHSSPQTAGGLFKEMTVYCRRALQH